MTRRILLILLALFVCCGQAPAAEQTPEPEVSGARVLAVGVFDSFVQQRQKDAGVADGIRDKAAGFLLVRNGPTVEVALGDGIGLRYVLRGEPAGAKVNVDVVVRHPAMVSPDTGKTMTSSAATYERIIGRTEHSVWSFDTPAGLIPGDYVIELVHKGRTLTRQEFHVSLRK
jgi:hypothetical protein